MFDGYKTEVGEQRAITRPMMYLCNENEEDTNGYVSVAFLSRKIREAYQAEDPEQLQDLLDQLVGALQSEPSEEELNGIFLFDVLSILMQFVGNNSFPRLNHVSLNCLVQISERKSDRFRACFQTPRFCDIVLAGMKTEQGLARAYVLRLLSNVLAKHELHPYILERFNIERLVDLCNTPYGDVVSEALYCVKQFAGLPLTRERSNAVLKVLAFIQKARQPEYVMPSLWTIMRLIKTESLDFEEFQNMGLLEFVIRTLESSSEEAVLTACRTFRMLYGAFNWTEPGVVDRLMQILERDRTISRYGEETKSSSAAALTCVLSRDQELSNALLERGLFAKLIEIFDRRNIMCKVEMIRLLHVLITNSTASTFDIIIKAQEKVTIVSLCLEACEVQEVRIVKNCLTLFTDYVSLAVRFGREETVKPAFADFANAPCWKDFSCDDPEVITAFADLCRLCAQ